MQYLTVDVAMIDSGLEYNLNDTDTHIQKKEKRKKEGVTHFLQ